MAETEVGHYQQIKRLVASGLTPVCRASYSAHEYESWRSDSGEELSTPRIKLDSRIQLKIDDFDYLVPLNDPPLEGWTLLPVGSTVQVTKESEHYDHLLEFVPESGQGLLYATLHITEGGVRTKFEQAEVCVDGEPIGVLSKQMGGAVRRRHQAL